MPMRVAVAVSGRGSNLEALLDSLPPGAPAAVVLVLSDRAAAGGLEVARRRRVATHLLTDPTDANEWLAALERARAELLVLAGYLKLVPEGVIAAWRGRIINVHPALLPAFGGAGMYGRRVHEAVLRAGVPESGASVHLVDEVFDHGEVLAQERVPVLSTDDPDSLAARVLAAEHRVLPAVVLAAARAGKVVPLAMSSPCPAR